MSRDVLDRMTDVLQHRGPDGRGTYYKQYVDGSGVALGHRRLSIIDLEGGQQPISNEDGTIWITFNGEIYNYIELRAELQLQGHRFRTNTDTETIVHLYEQHGVNCLRKLRGMFAFAIWDQRKRRVFMARDRLGQKPLVYRVQPGRLLLASEIKALLLAPGVSRNVDFRSIDQFLTYGYVPPPRTMFAGIYKLPPAHFAIFQRGELNIQQYWSPDALVESMSSIEALRSDLQHQLSESVRLRLRSDAPLGAFLSGGMDSTTIVGLMSQHLQQAPQTFTVGFSAADFDERPLARITAEHFRTEHHETEVEASAIDLLPLLSWHFDDPIADSSVIPTYQVARLSSQHVKVALTGDGGDELFAGYPRYRTIDRMSIFDRLPASLRRTIANPLWDWLPPGRRASSLWSRLRFRLQILREPFERRYINWLTGFHNGLRERLYSPALSQQLNGYDRLQYAVDAMDRSVGRSAGKRAMHTDLLTYLPCDLLHKVDITSMAHGLECRSPLLDHRVVELATAIPFRHLVQGETTKPMLSSTFRSLVPPPLRNQPKQGFGSPMDAWLRGDLAKWATQILLDNTTVARGYFVRTAIERLLNDHAAGRANHGDRLWALASLEMWHRTFLDADTSDLQPPAPTTSVPQRPDERQSPDAPAASLASHIP